MKMFCEELSLAKYPIFESDVRFLSETQAVVETKANPINCDYSDILPPSAKKVYRSMVIFSRDYSQFEYSDVMYTASQY